MKEKVKNRKFKNKWRVLRAYVNRGFLNRTEVLAITGSCGKTSATYFLGRILESKAPTYVGLRDNCQLAIFKSLKQVKRSHHYLVHEVGVAAPGQMSKMTPLLRPHVGVVTTIGSDHYSNFRTLETTAEEKGGLIEALPASGTAVLNADDPHVLSMAERTRASILTFGIKDGADVRASNIRATWPDRLSLTLTYRGEDVRLETALFGDLVVTSLLAAVAAAIAVGISLQDCAHSLKEIKSFPGRMSIHITPQRAWIISDVVKASFWSVEHVLALFVNITAPRKTLVIGSFSDTGAGSDSQKYRRIARQSLNFFDRVIFVGRKACHVKKIISADLEGRLFTFDSVREGYNFLYGTMCRDELVLVKSNKLEHLERFIVGHTDGFSCWKEICHKNVMCDHCNESGIYP